MFAVKRALKLNNKEATLMAKHAGFRRVVFNAALEMRQALYDSEIKVSDSKVFAEFKKLLTGYIKKQPENAWMNDLSSRVYQNALRDLSSAYSDFRSGKKGHPKFAKKKNGQSFTVDSSNGKVLVASGKMIKIPTLGTFRLQEEIPESYMSQTFTISKEGAYWFVSFTVDAERLPVSQPLENVGIDVGIKAFATLSDGRFFDAPKPFKQVKTKLARLQRKASKQVKRSSNQKKTFKKIAKLHAKAANIRKDFLHKLTTTITKTFASVHVEDLNVKGMMANHKLAGAIADLGFYEFKRQIEYKCKMYGATLTLVDQWYPSTKTCSSCGAIKPMPLGLDVYDCQQCGHLMDRDLNAAINIARWESPKQPQALRG